jgi:predicted transcriptional regulator
MQPLLPTMSEAMRPLLLSLKPRYADLIFEGLKTAELRRRIASHIENRAVFVYVSSPTMEIRGGFRVGKVWHGDPEEIWHMVSKLARVDKQDFDTYFEGLSFAYAFEIKEVWEYRKPVSLNALRNEFPNFVVPQSWRYVRPEEHEFFIEIEPKINEPDCRIFNLSLSDTSNFTRGERDNGCAMVVNPG